MVSQDSVQTKVTLQNVYYKLGQIESALDAALRQFSEQQNINASLIAKNEQLHEKIERIQNRLAWYSGAAAVAGASSSFILNHLLNHT